jgi:surface carbohydrate biosynthesis protein
VEKFEPLEKGRRRVGSQIPSLILSFLENNNIFLKKMFFLIKKLWRYLSYFSQVKKVWTWPRQSAVLIYDAANSEILLEYLNPWNPEVLHVRKEQINIRILLRAFFKRGIRSDAYIDCFIEKVRPRLVITTIDNNTAFYKISARHPDIKTLFLQNGIRSYLSDIFEDLDNIDSETSSKYFIDHILVFGSVIGERYSRYLKGSVLPTGSIKNNFASKKNSAQPGVIAYVGMWRLSTGESFARNRFFSFEDVWTHPDTLVIQCLMHYARENDKRLKIIPNSNFSADRLRMEKEYFRELMGVEPEYFDASGPYTCYDGVDSAEIVVASESTLAYESVARHKKTAFFHLRTTLLEMPDLAYGWPGDFPDEGPFWTNKPDPDIFIRILDYLFEVSDEQWKKDVESTNFSSLMEYDPGNTIFQSILEKELGPPPTSTH